MDGKPTVPRRTRNQSAPVTGNAMARIVMASLELVDKSMFLEALSLCHGSVSIAMVHVVGSALLRWDLQSILPKLAVQMSGVASFHDLKHVISNISHGITDEHRLHPVEEDVRKFYANWCDSEAHKGLYGMKLIYSIDGKLLAHLAKSHELSYTEKHIIPKIRRNCRHTLTKPITPKDWTRLQVTYSCNICKPLNDFLMDPLKETLTFISPPTSEDAPMGDCHSDWGLYRDVEDKSSVTATKHTKTNWDDWQWNSSYGSTKKTAIGSQIVAAKQKEEEKKFKRKDQHKTPLHHSEE
ncbi:uncharacterized protein PAC_16545 [Phialocephala subalpina]|uniref:Uncharacterized protein n=1 Tax=Phialocephala subalpina TaxID=576137 RepID=A0A1L7XNQ3_9HELO|nr:uncharacterized protein PAC_16545 [Phialocephala subalpina]